jgi:hypothetical protein
MRKIIDKNKLCFFWLTIGGLTFLGCDDFLKQSSQNLVIPKTAAQYKEILQMEGYFRDVLSQISSAGSYAFIEYMTDDVEYFDALRESNVPTSWYDLKRNESDKVETFSGCYRWEESIENTLFVDHTYGYLYKQAMVANICLEGAETCEGTKAEIEILRGQASFSRAFAYLTLANIYSKPYASLLGKANPNDLCVPVKTTSTPTIDTYGRASIGEVWGLISADINRALIDLKGKNLEQINRYEINYPAALILAIRIALYMEDWDRVITLGEEFMNDYSGKYPLYDISNKTTAGPKVDLGDETGPLLVKFINARNSEIVWPFGTRGPYGYSYTIVSLENDNNMSRYFRVSAKANRKNKSLISMYDNDDRRKAYWFFNPTPSELVSPSVKYDYITVKAENSTKTDILYACFAFRTAEVYLSLAEAYARKPAPESEKVIELINALREKRFAAPYTPLLLADYPSDALVQLVWDERRRELCFEELHRWWDLRRTTQPRIEHQWRDYTYYVLEEGDPAYTLNFPDAELVFSGSVLVPNERPNKTAVPE